MDTEPRNTVMDKTKKVAHGEKTALYMAMILGICAINLIGCTASKEIAPQQDTPNASLAPTILAQDSQEAVLEAQQAAAMETEKEEPPVQWEGWLEDYARTPDKIVDFNALRQINADIYAWITLPGTSIDYPIVFAPKDSLWYLDHDAEGEESERGAIYTDGHNSLAFSDPLTLVYGHNMKDGTMFASLHQFENDAFFEENRIIRIYMADYMLEYEIIAAYKAGDSHILAQNDFEDPAVFSDYLKELYAMRDLNAKLRAYELNVDDRLIALVTCVQGEGSARYFVQGVLQTNA
ncbi:MAG: class B sortase [Candidatus Pelethousia sp.]|nr:class B sortase [Candidatus Pelethousia sp.]